jgi:hypothetical protein
VKKYHQNKIIKEKGRVLRSLRARRVILRPQYAQDKALLDS